MPILILSPRYTPDSTQLWQAALRAKWSTMRLQSHRAPDELKGQEVVLYGEGLFVTIIAEQLEIVLLESPLDWLPNLPLPYRLREISLSTLKDARSITHPAFIKPTADKTFDSKVYASGAELPSAEFFDDNTSVLIAEPVEWELEFRFFISGRKVQTFSPYSRHGELVTDNASDSDSDEALHFVEQILADERVPIAPGIVLDIGKIINRGWAVVESNPAWASGIYACNPNKILEVLSKSCTQQSHLSETDFKWVIQRT